MFDAHLHITITIKYQSTHPKFENIFFKDSPNFKGGNLWGFSQSERQWAYNFERWVLTFSTLFPSSINFLDEYYLILLNWVESSLNGLSISYISTLVIYVIDGLTKSTLFLSVRVDLKKEVLFELSLNLGVPFSLKKRESSRLLAIFLVPLAALLVKALELKKSKGSLHLPNFMFIFGFAFLVLLE